MKIKIILTCLFLNFGLNIIAQTKNEEYYLNYDYFSHSYKYLDEDFNIKISHEKFQSLMSEFDFYPERVTSYRDSLAVTLCGEFDNWRQVNIGVLRLSFNCERIGYYLWISEAEAEELVDKYGLKYPYKFYEYFRSNDESIWDDYMKQFMSDLRNKVYKSTNNSSVFTMSNKELTSFALVNNPQRIEDFKKLQGSCKEENCCQNQDSNKEPCDSLANSQ